MILASRTKIWLRLHGGLAMVFAMLGALASSARGTSAGRDMASLTIALGRTAGEGQEVAGSDLRWEASGGIVADFVLGRPALFLARPGAEDARDVWLARVRLSPEGAVLGVVGARNITNTPLGDDHELIVSGTHAAFATRAYGQEQSVTVLDLASEGAQNKTEGLADRVMAALTNVQRTASLTGMGRVDVTLESPAPAASLSLTNAWLDVALSDGRAARLDLSSGELVSPVAGVRADGSVHLPKRFSHWAVDTLRAIPWIGPAPIAWLEDRALSSRDLFRRITFRSRGGSTDVVAVADSQALPLDPTKALKDDNWPPRRIPTIWKSPEAGEGEWVVPDVPWLRAVPGVSSDAPSPFYRTYVRPDEERPYVKVLLVAMDARQVDVEMEAGVEDPEPLTGPHGVGHVPRDPAIYRRIALAFNGAFKTEHGHYGMMVHKRVLLPPVPGSATVVLLSDGRVGFGSWGPERRIGGIDGVDDEAIVSYRQNLDPLIDGGRLNPTGRNIWGYTLPGKGAQTERSALCVTSGGHIVYAWGDDVSATTLAKSIKMAGCDYGMHLDMNPYHTGFLFTAIDDLAGKKYKSQLLTPAMSIPLDRYIQYAPKDFFYVMVHDWEPPQVQGRSALPWVPSAGTQPPPRWMPGLWSVRMDGSPWAVELVDVESGRTTWRIRAGAEDARAAAPLRELIGEEASRALLAAGMGVALDKRPRGIATDGRLAVPVRGASDSGALVVGDDGRMTFVRAQDARSIGPHSDMVELPIVLWDGSRQPTPSGPVVPRAVIGVTPGGRILFARATVPSVAPLADALVNAGCTRALALDRGARATAFFHRAGTDTPPRVRYDETVVYAIASSLAPRAFHFTASVPAVQDAKPR